MRLSSKLLLVLGLFPVLALALRAAPADAVIARARAYLGTDKSLDAVRSIHYLGTIEFRDDRGKIVPEASGTMEMIVQKPAQHLNIRTTDRMRETVGLDDLSGWQQVETLQPPLQRGMAILPPAQLRRLQAITFENLAFFHGLEARGGRVDLRGESTIDGKAVVALAFVHSPEVVFVRYFDKATGRLVMSEDPVGGQVREEGEIVVNGVRFPQRMRSAGRTQDGKPYTVTISFEKITVNETFPNERFAAPLSAAK